ncbi:hypothetical protein TraAM80_07220 [Trypanosoma rangeli]|uniref:Uncharacterized protein n=1 Tax=Trypanosoma rangeli TaxID=5698 RepID=A0A3R7KTI3_TRYRA|nr:uncharacterized protein TraAM80_07220 [Trypanosoma rangeli]RNF01058.1 hypothetical protein TraAM80_07220 [Trypanosoma rangeli]|eukprot:RNF01058.1 hypothetical protein TraAM80_07220 [Trypanosoma rangeli]
MFFSTKIFFGMLLLACVVLFLCADFSRLPTKESAMLDISRLLHKTGDCNICGDVLRSLDTFQLSRSTSLIRATQGYDKPHSAFIRACEENPNTLGCDTALDRDRAERMKRASLIIMQVEQLPVSKERGISNLLHRRYDDFMTYLMNEKEQEMCLTCVVENGRLPSLSTSQLADTLLDSAWYHIYPINERHQAFCWRHCEGLLTYSERLYLWFLRFYITRAVRLRLMALQGEYAIIALILGQLALLVVILQRYVTDVRGGAGGGSHVCGNLHTDNTPAGGLRSGTRRSTLGRGKGGGGAGRRD